MIGNERKKEFAILRGMGASRRELSGIITKEIFYVSASGGLIGALSASCILLLFGSLIRSGLKLPFLLPGTLTFLALFLCSVGASIIAGILSSALCVSKVSHVDTALVLRGDN
jgi:putative ABC transport system permease protein